MSSELPARSSTRVINLQASIVRQSGRGRLVIVNGPDRGASVLLADTPITFGSGSGSDFRLSDPTVSRRHLLAAPGEGGLLVRDLGSTNGSFVRGARFGELLLGFGGEIQIGQTHIKYVPEEEAVEVPPLETERFGSLVGRDPKMRQLFRLIGDIAGSDTTVLIEGETGTGKELFAEEIHRASPRRGGPFVVFDCGAVPRELIESALFGHVRGAFTGAFADRRGAFAEADGGTLFLDEIGELALEVQPALLRALDKRAVRPVGGQQAQSFSVRVVAATNRDLRSEVAAAPFPRRSLLPSGGVPPGGAVTARASRRRARCWCATSSPTCPGGGCRCASRISQRLARYAFPGNVRELRNLVERACALTRGDTLDFDSFLDSDRHTPAPTPGAVAYDLPFKQAKAQIVDQFERAYLERLMEHNQNNLSAAARAADLDRKHLRELLRKHGLITSEE